VTEVVGTSTDSIQQAVRNGISRASQTLRNLDWFQVTEIRGHIVDGDVGHFQVTMKIGFKLEG
jgi:flavin-binding protein dodecin